MSEAMRAYMEKQIDAVEPDKDGLRVWPAQLYFRHSHVVPTPQGLKMLNVVAGGVAKTDTPGLFKVLSVGEMPNENGRGSHPVLIECLFEAEAIYRVDVIAKHLEEQKIVSAGGSIISPH